MNEPDMKKILGMMACTLQDLAELVKVSCEVENVARYDTIHDATVVLLKWIDELK